MSQRLLSYLKDDPSGESRVIQQEPTELSDAVVQEMDEFLRKIGVISETEEIAITEKL